MCLLILLLALLTPLTGDQFTMRPSPSPGVGPSSRNAALTSPSRASRSVADVKGFLDEQAQKIDELERELYAEKQKTSELEKALHAEKQKTSELKKTIVAENKKTQDAQQEVTTWKEKYENLVKWREEAKASLNVFMRDDSGSH
jgi:septal ring factor EnvC (AmiA/AmiB activator)